MNYYIQGNKEKADQIKAAFEAKGFIPRIAPMYYGSESVLFFTGTDNYIYETPSPWVMDIIKTHPDYQELELPVKPNFKVGDWITDGACKVKITDINNTNYWYSKNCILGEIESIDKKYHLWTIQDAKDGDVLALNGKPFIYSSHKYGKNYCYIDEWGQLRVNFSLVFEGNYVCPATKQERDLLFAKMKDAGYEWDADKKELHKIQPHYDIANFKPYQKVLIRFGNNDTWRADFFSHIKEDRGRYFVGIGYANKQCIPFEGNEHLLGTTEMCPQEYINW